MRRIRGECLDQHRFASLEEARTTIEAWRVEYNTERPHGALGQRTPEQVANGWDQATEAAD
jgi:putative transposase